MKAKVKIGRTIYEVSYSKDKEQNIDVLWTSPKSTNAVLNEITTILENRVVRLKRGDQKLAKGWQITFTDGTVIETGYYPNPRMAVAEALKQHKGKVQNVKYI